MWRGDPPGLDYGSKEKGSPWPNQLTGSASRHHHRNDRVSLDNCSLPADQLILTRVAALAAIGALTERVRDRRDDGTLRHGELVLDNGGVIMLGSPGAGFRDLPSSVR